jgi:hypothetical protein
MNTTARRLPVATIGRLCASVEALQRQLSVRKDQSDAERQCYEAVADAKRRLMDALKAAERHA